jgi:hypothetical protein
VLWTWLRGACLWYVNQVVALLLAEKVRGGDARRLRPWHQGPETFSPLASSTFHFSMSHCV